MGLLELLHRFNVVKVTSISVEDLDCLQECIDRYIKGAKEDSIAPHEVLNIMEESLVHGVWFLYQDKKVVGFLVANVRQDQYRNIVCFVEYLYVDAGVPWTWARMLATVGIAWVKSTGLKKIIFLTRRNPKVMQRLLPGDWKLDSVMLSLCV